MAVRDTFDLIAPEFSADPNADGMLTLAANRISPAVFGSQLELAVAYLAAHMLALSRRAEQSGGGGGGVGPVTGERAGEVSRNYGSVNFGGQDLAYYASTPYGLEYLNIRRGRAGTRMFATTPNFFGDLGSNSDG